MKFGNIKVPDAFIRKFWHMVERTAVDVFEGDGAAVRAAIAALRKAPPEEFLLILNAGPLSLAADLRGVAEVSQDQLAHYDQLVADEAWIPKPGKLVQQDLALAHDSRHQPVPAGT
jgi:hypothetical protein